MQSSLLRRGLLSVGMMAFGLFFAGHSVAHAASWVQLTSPTSTDLNGVYCDSSTHCIAVGKSGVVVYTTNGTTWQTGVSGVTTSITDVSSPSSATSFAVGASGKILKTTDSGATWTAQTSGVTESLDGVHFISTTTGWVIGSTSGKVLKTTDGGTTWTLVSILGTTLHDITANSSSSVWAAGNDGAVFHSADGGTTWSTVSYPMTPNDIMSIHANSSSTAYIVGQNGFFAYTENGGTSWTYHAITGFATGEHATDFIWTEGSEGGTVVGSAGSIVLISNDASTFTVDIKAFSVTDITSITRASTSRRFIVGNGGFIGTYDSAAPAAPGSLALTSGASYTNDTTPSLSWTAASDSESSIASYEVKTDTGEVWGNVGNVLSASVTDVLPAGSHTVYVRAVDAASNNSTATSATFTVDTTAPTVDVVSPTSATTGSSMTFSATVSDATSGISSCSLLVNGSSVGAMTYSSTLVKYSVNYSFTSSGSYSVQASCTDVAGNTASGSAVTVVASSSTTPDTTAPSVGQITQTTATKNASTTLSATVSDSVGLSSCTLYVSGVSAGTMSISGDTASYSYTFTSTGTYSSVYAKCSDAAGNVGTGSTQTVTVSSDTTAPSVGQISQSSVTEDSATTLSATVSDNVAISSCSFYSNSAYVGLMTVSGSTASYSYTYSTSGTYSVYATCVDSSGNVGIGTLKTVTVSAASDQASKRNLIKTSCGSTVLVNDPCTAVYYYGDDGARHAFPNENVFYTWYTNFDSVVIVTSDFMASLSLGHNVTYHPGTKMVKFVTVNTVYAVGTNGELRGIISEDVAQSLYGSTWNKQIDDISDAFHSNYTIGTTISSTSDYSPSTVQAGSTSIEDVI